MPFTFADDVGSISANRLLKKYKKLRALGNSFIHHTTDSQGQTFNFVMFTANFQNKFALDLYNGFLAKYPVVNDKNRKGVDKELDELIKIAEANLPKREQEQPVLANRVSPFAGVVGSTRPDKWAET